jgi:hypothetical protein
MLLRMADTHAADEFAAALDALRQTREVLRWQMRVVEEMRVRLEGDRRYTADACRVMHRDERC